MVMASFLFMKKMGDAMEESTKLASLRQTTPETAWIDEILPVEIQKQVFVKRLDGPLFFGSVSGFQSLVLKLPDVKYIIIRMERVPFMDQSGLYVLEDSILQLEQEGKEVLLTGLNKQPAQRMKSINIIPELIKKDNIFESFSDCVKWIGEQHK
jgi:SulP family sulfate permease